MNATQQFEILGRKQLALQEGVQLMQQVRTELARNAAAADAWGTTAVLANVALIPLNVIVNAFELKGANSVYQALVRQLNGKFGKSGTRLDGHAKTALALVKQVVIEELRRKAMRDMIPGVNILVGLAEDSLAALQAIQLVESGNREITTRAGAIERQLAAAIQQMLALGVRRAQLLERMQLLARTA